jgi:hypothetical protein
MRSLIIYSIFISAFFAIRIKKKLEINQEHCNDSKNLFFPINLKFTTLVNDQENIQVNASALAPCDRIDSFKIEVILNGIYTSMKFNSEDKMFSEALSRTAPMSFQETSEWWKSFIGGFKSVVVGAKVSTTDDLVLIEIKHMNPQVLMHLESLKIPFEEGVYNYDIDSIMEQRNPKPKTVITHQEMTPELLEMFKQQLMKNGQMDALINQMKQNGSGDIKKNIDGSNKIEIIVKEKIVNMMDKDKKNQENFLI